MTILCFHTVEPSWDSPLALTPQVFERTCAWLAERRHMVPLETAVRKLDRRYRPTGRTSAITFDDGWAGVAQHAWPILQNHQLPMTLFVIADSLRSDSIDLSWVDRPPDAPLRVMGLDEVRQLASEGVHIGSHSMRHADLRTLGFEGCLADLAESKELLEDLLERPVTTMAYPKGHHDETVRRAAARAGYEWAFTLPEKREPYGQFSVPRVGVYPGNTDRTLYLKTRRRYLDARLHPWWPGS